jgi:hypothetical protein
MGHALLSRRHARAAPLSEDAYWVGKPCLGRRYCDYECHFDRDVRVSESGTRGPELIHRLRTPPSGTPWEPPSDPDPGDDGGSALGGTSSGEKALGFEAAILGGSEDDSWLCRRPVALWLSNGIGSIPTHRKSVDGVAPTRIKHRVSANSHRTHPLSAPTCPPYMDRWSHLHTGSVPRPCALSSEY